MCENTIFAVARFDSFRSQFYRVPVIIGECKIQVSRGRSGLVFLGVNEQDCVFPRAGVVAVQLDILGIEIACNRIDRIVRTQDIKFCLKAACVCHARFLRVRGQSDFAGLMIILSLGEAQDRKPVVFFYDGCQK